jgi:adenine-specific DNA-methyltransferase
MWLKIRGKRLAGLKFRRQHVVGNFIADFVCLPARLIIEVDGDTHGGVAAEVADAKRTEEIVQAGYRVIRVWDHYVLNDTDGGVVETILDALMRRLFPSRRRQGSSPRVMWTTYFFLRPLPDPLPCGERGNLLP